MATTQAEIREWLERAKKNGATHVIVVCDTYDHEDYPVEVKPGEDVKHRTAEYSGPNMQRVMEVYSLTGKHDVEAQLAEHRAFHYD